MNNKIWETRTVRLGEEAKLLGDGWEPYCVYAEDSSYQFMNTSTHRRETEHRSTPYICLRRLVLWRLHMEDKPEVLSAEKLNTYQDHGETDEDLLRNLAQEQLDSDIVFYEAKIQSAVNKVIVQLDQATDLKELDRILQQLKQQYGGK